MNRLSAMNKLNLFLILFGLLFFSCDKEPDSPVPDVPVNLNIPISDLGEGASKKYFGGYGGVIVYCLSPGEYYAYDACCTHELSKSAVVEPDGALGICNTCGSKYILIDGGFPSSDSPSKIPLRQYNVAVSGGYIHVWN